MRLRGKNFRLTGVALLLAALFTLAVEAYGWWRDDVWESASLGAAWASVNANSLVGLGAFVENSISPWLWIEILVPVLIQPLWLVLGLPGAVLVLITRRRRRKSIFFKK
jgi:hypothetical protein